LLRRLVRTTVLGFAVAAVVSGCDFIGPLRVAVENHGGEQVLLRILDGQHRAWVVPAGSSGIGPTDDGRGDQLVVITTMDCVELGRLGFRAGDHTLFVTADGMEYPDQRSSIDPGLSRLTEIEDPCP
jgi:hypothetical protein